MILYAEKETTDHKIISLDHAFLDISFKELDRKIKSIAHKYYKFNRNTENFIIYAFTEAKPFTYNAAKSRKDYLDNYLDCRAYVYDASTKCFKRFEPICEHETLHDIGLWVRSEEMDFKSDCPRFNVGDIVRLNFNNQQGLYKIIADANTMIDYKLVKYTYYIPNVYAIESIDDNSNIDTICEFYQQLQYDNKWHYTDLIKV